jgi:nucleotide-binding universal stress UspA family protein
MGSLDRVETFDEPRAIVTKYKQHRRPRIAQGNADWRKGSGLPLLVKARTVDLLIALNEKTDNPPNVIRGAEMAKHLARHDVKVQIVTFPAADIDVCNAILSYVADVSGTLIVMGGYGHAKLRELILGGVTRNMLKSMTAPVFMSH